MNANYDAEFAALTIQASNESLKLAKALIVSLDVQPESEGTPAPASSYREAVY
jgi:hypothetical protein